MKKKYLKTIEEILSLRDTDTKIYTSYNEATYFFINGTLCLKTDKSCAVNVTLFLGDKPYILVEEPVKEADENDIGKLCKFWNDDIKDYAVGTLCKVHKRVDYSYCIGCCDCWYKYCCRLTPTEVAEITGYKVEE